MVLSEKTPPTKIKSFPIAFFWLKSNMRKSIYRKPLNLEHFCNCDTLYLYWNFDKNVKVTKKIKILKFEADWDDL